MFKRFGAVNQKLTFLRRRCSEVARTVTQSPNYNER